MDEDEELTEAARKFRDRHSVPAIITEIIDDVTGDSAEEEPPPPALFKLPPRSMSDPMVYGLVREVSQLPNFSAGESSENLEQIFNLEDEESKGPCKAKRPRVAQLSPSPVLSAIRIRQYLKAKVESSTSDSKNGAISLDDVIKEAEEEDRSRRSRNPSVDSAQLTGSSEPSDRSSPARLSIPSLKEATGPLPLKSFLKKAKVDLDLEEIAAVSRQGRESALISAKNRRREERIYKDYKRSSCGSKTEAREEREIQKLLEVSLDVQLPSVPRKRETKKPKVKSKVLPAVDAKMDEFKIRLVYDFLLKESIYRTQQSFQTIEDFAYSELGHEDTPADSNFESREAILQLITTSVDFPIWESSVKSIHAMVPKQLRKKFSQLLKKITEEFSIEYSDVLHEVSMRSTVLPNLKANIPTIIGQIKSEKRDTRSRSFTGDIFPLNTLSGSTDMKH